MSHAPTAALDHRHRIIRDDLSARSLDALVVTALPNILYLTNFTGSTAIAVVTFARVHFLTDFRYVTALADSRGTAHECPNLDLVTVEGSYDASLVALLASLNPRQGSGPAMRIGFEAAHLTVSRHTWLVDALARHGSPHTLVATEGVVEHARVRKDDYEIATLREAARRLSRVAEQVIADVRAGQSEQDVAMAIEQRLRQAGFAKPAFDTIVAAGPNAALPHAGPESEN
jgi:Xaa-Pro aminopeptidase